jgi:hypothetical protein
MTLQPVPLPKACRLLNHGPTVLVSSAHAGRRNVMAAAWSMPLDFDPPKVAVVIDKATFTRELIEASGEFVLAVPTRSLAAQTLAAGSSSGKDGDKFDALGLEVHPASQVAAPLPAGCIGWLECRVIEEPTFSVLTTCSLPKWWRPGPIRRLSPMVTGISRLTRSAAFTILPEAIFSSPARPST